MTTQVLARQEVQAPAPTTPQDPEMTEEGFLQEFQEIAPRFIWITEGGALRGYANGFIGLVARLCLVTIGIKRASPPQVCPITAVARILTGKFYASGDYAAAARAIGLSQNLSQRIVSAADCNLALGPLRQRLLQIAGLK